ncbi:MAG: IS110 family transposase [Oscillospiraceae bacterium]|nr:IS110 family transposase [Oscillospiraceae bacterium]
MFTAAFASLTKMNFNKLLSGNITKHQKEGFIMISVGIDVSKGKSTVCIMKPCGEILESPFDINHTADELDSLISLIKSFDEETRVVMEDTGHYHLPVATYLSSHNIFVCCINALRMKKFCSQSIRRAKTDKIDSIKIAAFGITYWNELVKAYPSDVIYDELKFLARQYYQVTGMLVKSKVNFSNLLDQVMPKINDVLSNQGENHKLTEFVSRYIHFQNILDMGERKFTSDYCKWAKKKGYRLNERKAAEILALAQNGIPTLPNSQSVKIAVSEAIKLIHSIEESRNTILAQMQELCNTLPEYSVVKEMDCIGDTLAPRIIAEIGDVRRFKNKPSLIAYAGIDAPPYQSGAFHASERHISKRGNSYLRKTGYEIMQSLIKHKPADNAVYDFIQKKHSEGKCGKEAMIAGLNKFLRVYYGKVMELYSER